MESGNRKLLKNNHQGQIRLLMEVGVTYTTQCEQIKKMKGGEKREREKKRNPKFKMIRKGARA